MRGWGLSTTGLGRNNGGSADRNIGQPLSRQAIQWVKISTIKDDFRGHALGHFGKVWRAELRPLGANHQRICAIERRAIVGGKNKIVPIAIDAARLSHGDWVKSGDGSPCVQEGLHNYPRRCLAHIIGIRFDGEAPESNALAIKLRCAAKVGSDFFKQRCFGVY